MIFRLLFSAVYFSATATSSTSVNPSCLAVYSEDSCGPSGEDAPVPIRREVYGDGRIYDISHRYTVDMPSWESDEGLGQFLWLPSSMKNGSLANNSEMKFISVHSGTHVDAPGHVYDHYFDAGFDVDTLDLHVLNGPALLVDVPRHSNITGVLCSKKSLTQAMRALSRTAHSGWWITQTSNLLESTTYRLLPMMRQYPPIMFSSKAGK